MAPFEYIRSKLANVSRDGKSARCPAHDDRRNSLALDEGEDGQALLHCHAGCAIEDVVAAKGLTMRDLFPRENGKPPTEHLVATYEYKDENGWLLFRKHRYLPKRFVLDRKLTGIRRVLYRLPELIAADPQAWVFVVEGEKDCDRLVTRGLVATSSPFGASETPSEKKWLPEFNQFFRNRRVIVIPDNDPRGTTFAWYEAEQLLPVAQEVRLIELPNMPPSGDVSDFFDRGGTREQLVEIVNATPKVTELKIDFWKDSQRKRKASAGSSTSACSRGDRRGSSGRRDRTWCGRRLDRRRPARGRCCARRPGRG